MTRHRRRPWRIRTVLLAGIFVPIAAIWAVSSIVVTERWSARATSQRVEHVADELARSLRVVAALVDEQALSVSHILTAQVGGDSPYQAALTEARQSVDDNDVPADARDALSEVRALRAAVDDGTVTFDVLISVYATAIDALTVTWADQMTAIDQIAGSRDRPAWYQDRMGAVRESVEMLAPSVSRVHASMALNLGSSDPGVIRELFAANRAFAGALRRIELQPGSRVEQAIDDFRADPAAQATEQTFAHAELAGIGAEPGLYVADVTGLLDGLGDGARWASLIAAIAVAATEDLVADARDQATADTRTAAEWLLAAVATMLLAIAVGVLTARRLSTPAHDLAIAAREVAAGNLDTHPVPLHGPREVREVITAFNDMTATLSAVEGAAVALADDHGSSRDVVSLPGRTGRALQAALDRLSASVAEAEQHRARLDVLATHDGLTGLLNRTAALEAVDRDLHRARRDGTAVGVLFVDLDGLKTINDEYGHAAGDDALRQCAAALRDGARSGDVPARLGGDEFLISAIVDRGDRDSLTALAERVRERVSSQVIAVGDRWVPLRCSVGVALCDDASTDASGLISAADTALYQAKRAGRNRVSW